MRKAKAGFTTMELLVVLAILGILAIIAVPTLMNELPRYRLKKAANELYGNMQRARMGAIKENQSWTVTFSASGYSFGTHTVNFADYKSGVGYGNGNAGDAIGAGFGVDYITYNSKSLVFNSRGTGSAGYVYLQNNQGDAFAVGTLSSGVIILREWHNGAWQ
jgi:type II secretion system protein H